jgi:hypothetical protein
MVLVLYLRSKLTGHDPSRPRWTANVTVAELIAELRTTPPHVMACILDDQGFPYQIGRIRYDANLDMVIIESRWPPQTTRWWSVK